MPLFGRSGGEDPKPWTSAVGVAPPLTPDQNEVVRELSNLAMDGMRECPIEHSTLALLQVGLPYLTQRECSEPAIVAGQTSARLGYLSRSAEFAMFGGAQELDEELLDMLAARLEAAGDRPGATEDAVAELAAELALDEPVQPGAPGGGPLWSLPGAGGDLRVALRDQLARALDRPRDVSIEELKQAWMYGFFLRGLQECFEDEDMTS